MSIGTLRFSALLAVLPALALAGCDRAEDARGPAPDAAAPSAGAAERDAGTVDPAPVDASATVDATRVVDHAPVAGAGHGFDVRAFAGAFGTDGMRLEFAPDGTYALAVRAESAGAELETTGTWTVEGDGARIRLDPDSKDEGDRVFAVVSRDELAPDDGGQALRRVGD